jgi:hypothetical protein
MAQTRKGAKRLAAGISVGATPVTVPFTLHGGDPVTSIMQSANVATVTTATPHGLGSVGNQYYVEIAGVTGATAANYNGKWTVTVTGASTFTYNVSGSPASNPPGTITWAWPVLLTTYSGGLFGCGVYSSPRYDYNNEYIVLAGPSSAYLYRQGSSLLTLSYPISPIAEQILPGDAVTTLQAFDRLFLFRWRSSEVMQKVASITQSSGTATVTTSAAHGFATGEVVRLTGSDQSGFNLDAVITVTSTTAFTVAVPSATAANTAASLFAQRVCCPLLWDGITSGFVRVPTGTSPLGPTYSRMVSPTGGIAAYYNNQVVICSGRDTVLVSDVLDPDTYDPMLKEFRTNTGSNDYITALHPYANGQILAFLRKSIYLGTIVISTSDGVSIDPTQSTLQLLTNEIGCNARMTVTTAGNYVYFLSDNGVYRLDNSQIDLALRGNTLPLSEPIGDLIGTINQAAIETSNAVYFNNRYYLAVPTGTATSPNTLLIYNQLNEAWESVDTNLPALDRLVVSDYGSMRRLFAASNFGALFLLEEYDSGLEDSGTGTAQASITGSITTRRYFYGQLAGKRLGNMAVSALLPSGSGVDVAAVTTDPDSTTTVASVSNPSADNDYTIRAGIRRRGTYLDLTVSTSNGRPTIRAITADAAVPSDASRLARTDS